MNGARRLALVGLGALAACRGAPVAAAPTPAAGGLLHADLELPPGAERHDRPQWQVGDRFTLVRGGLLTAEFVVEAADANGYVLRGPGGARLRRDLDLGNLGEWPAAGEQPQHLLSPVDVRYHWPLWVGKRWQCEFVDQAAGGPALRTRVDYEVEATDRVRTPAGTFDALRILRTARLVGAEDRVLWRTQVIWYAPSLGTEVRQVLADTRIDLVAFSRAGT
ncbi:MAG: hypothetical protein KF830_16100 [Planctomycetes bacterium]|nr:hypothetical protein [Planctomycetota bacterium]